MCLIMFVTFVNETRQGVQMIPTKIEGIAYFQPSLKKVFFKI